MYVLLKVFSGHTFSHHISVDLGISTVITTKTVLTGICKVQLNID